jgi:hypothetical protein
MKQKDLAKSYYSLVLPVLLTVLMSFISAAGQGGTSTINGSVSDPQGNRVAGASVTLSNEEKNFSRTQVSSDGGSFTFTLIPPGTYKLEVEAKGFKKAVLTDVGALIDKPSNVDITLEIGSVTESVTVSSGSGEVLLNTTDATLGNNFVNQQITQLPLEARNPISLLTLQPGVTRAGNVTGARSDQSNITLDGVDINEAQTNDINSPVLRLNAEAVEEFRVVTANPNATQGRSAGAQISLITKSGSNDWHGALFESHRNTVFSANTFFNNRSGIPRPKLIRNTFGGAVSGPIVKDRAFFFYSYEGRRDASQSSVAARTVPFASLGRGEVRFRGCPPGVSPCSGSNIQVVTLTPAQLTALFPVVGLNQTAISVLAGAASRYPANSPGGDTLNTGGFIFNAPNQTKLNAHQARFDFNLNKSGTHQVFLRGSYQNDTQPVSTTNAQQFPDTPLRTRWSHPLGYVAGHTWAIDSKRTNSFRYGVTRLAVSDQGDTTGNDIFFRFIYVPTTESYTFSRTNPVTNITDDFSWIAGNHNMQFGTNIRLTRNNRAEFGPGFDQALTNPLFYQSSGNVLINPLTAAGYTITSNADDLKAALAAVIGRFSQYTARFNFGIDGKPVTSGQPVVRKFATEEYDIYAQDSWKISPSITLTYGLRYGLSKPVYEQQGFMTKTNIPLGEYLRRRIENAYNGINYTETLIVNKTDQLYNWDKNNFQPRISIAWSPDAGDNTFGRILGRNGRSVIRGGFAMTNDYFGQQLAVTFNSQNTLGFASSQTTPANSFNVTTNPGPLFTGFGQSVQNLPGIVVPGDLTFPQQRSANNARRIESSLDSNLVSPTNYSWNISYQRDLPKGTVLEMAWIGRAARHLLAGRDAVQTNLNFRDPKSGQTWQEAASILEALRRNNTPVSQIPSLPFFENLYAPNSIGPAFAAAGFGSSFASLTNTQAVYRDNQAFIGNDWTTTQDDLDALSGRRYFYQPQYGALAVYSTIGSSDYNGGTISIRQRYKSMLTWDFNYTFSKSFDDISGTQTDAPFTPFILNALDIRQQRAYSDFDARHIINANAIYQLPFGHGRTFFSDAPSIVNGIVGGWQLSSIVRWNSGLPVEAPLDFGGWPTNWNRRNYVVRIADVQASPTRGGTTPANLFSDPAAVFHSFRSGEPGERGDRNIFRYPGFFSLDMGLYKSFGMPWSENHKFEIRWDVFNVTNTQRLTSVDGFVVALDPFKPTATPNGAFGNFTAVQSNNNRVMQFGFRYSF